MAHYSGIDLVAYFDTGGEVDISATERTVDVEETAEVPETIDVTHKGDTEKQTIEGLAGAQETNVSVTLLDETGTSEVKELPLNTKGTLKIYPEGETHGLPMLTVNDARMHRRRTRYPYNDAVEIELTFNAKNSTTYGTYSTT